MTLKEALEKFQLESPESFQMFMALVNTTKKTRYLSEKNRELIKMAVYTSLREPEAVGIHAINAVKAGASKEEIVETISLIMPNVGLVTASLCLQEALDTAFKSK